MRYRLCFLSLLLSLTIRSAGAFGLGDIFGGGGGFGGIVYDPTNHVETAISAAESVRQTALQVRAEIQRLQSLANEFEQLKSLPAETIQSGLADTLAQLNSFNQGFSTLTTLSTQLQGIRDFYATQLRQMAALGLSPEQYLRREADLAEARRQSAGALVAVHQQALNTVQSSMKRLSDLQAQIPQSSGVHQSLQTSNQYLDLLASQTAQLVELSAAQAQWSHLHQEGIDSDASTAASRQASQVASDLARIKGLRQDIRDHEAKNGLGIMRPLP